MPWAQPVGLKKCQMVRTHRTQLTDNSQQPLTVLGIAGEGFLRKRLAANTPGGKSSPELASVVYSRLPESAAGEHQFRLEIGSRHARYGDV